jgi:hypothetical protein
LDEPIPRAKPEVSFLKSGELCEIFGLESVAGDGRIFDKTQHSVARRWPLAALRAVPVFAFKAILARETPFHRALTFGAIYETNVLRR